MFLSQRPNTDPLPYASTNDNTRWHSSWHGAPSIYFDPRPEFTQTRDPEPFYSTILDMRSSGAVSADDVWSPRHEEFDAPVNPILAEFRSTWTSNYREGAQNWLIYIDGSWGIKSIEHSTVQQRDHARRVLSKLVAVYGG